MQLQWTGKWMLIVIDVISGCFEKYHCCIYQIYLSCVWTCKKLGTIPNIYVASVFEEVGLFWLNYRSNAECIYVVLWFIIV